MIHIDRQSGQAKRRDPRPYPMGPSSVTEIVDTMRRLHPHRTALRSGSAALTYLEMATAVAKCADSLRANGAEPGSVVLYRGGRPLDLVIGFLATRAAEAVWAAVQPGIEATEFNGLLTRLDPTVVVEGDTATHRRSSLRLLAADGSQQQPAGIALTSGTTGAPKIVVHSEHGLLWPAATSLATDPVLDDEIHFVPLTPSSLTVMLVGPVTALARGATVQLLEPGADLGAVLATSGATHMVSVPTLLHDLVERAERTDAKHLRRVIVGGARCEPDLRRRFVDRFDTNLVESYGLSEAPCGVARSDGTGSAALAPLPGINITVTEEQRIEVHPTSTGKWADCWQPTLGYLGDPDRTEDLLVGNGIRTQDLGSIDQSGRLVVHGRADAMIIRGGVNISPTEIERALQTHPDVVEAAVFAEPDDRLGSLIAACVVTSTGETPGDLRTYLKTRLALHKIPSRITVASEIPRGPLGKPRYGHALWEQ